MDDETRREFDRVWSSVQRMDEHGTRGVIALSVQVTELTKDIADFKLEINSRLSSAVQARRWLVGILVAMLGVIGGLISVAIQMADMRR